MVRTLQVTLSGSLQNITTVFPVGVNTKARWVTFQNNAAAVMRIGDAATTASRGISLAASGGTYSVPVAQVDTFGVDLTQWNVIGTSTNVLDVVFDDMNF